jgi:signal transduction histidine kinase
MEQSDRHADQGTRPVTRSRRAPEMDRTRPHAARAAAALGGLAFLLIAASTWLTLLASEQPPTSSLGSVGAAIGLALVILPFPVVGTLILSQRPRNGIGWLFSIDGLLAAAITFCNIYASVALETDPGSLPGGEVVSWIGDMIYLPLFAALTVYLFLLFPDGSLRTKAERIVALVGGVGLGLSVLGTALEPNLYSYPRIENPLGINGMGAVSGLAGGVAYLLGLGCLVASIILLVRRLRRAIGREHQQLRMLASSAVLSLVLIAPSFLLEDAPAVLLPLGAIGVILQPVSVGVAILRHRLLDIDLVIRRTVVFGLIAVFIVTVYVGVVVAVPALVLGRREEGIDLPPFLAAALIALALQPVLRWARRLAARLVYGDRATPYEVLSVLASRMSDVYADADLLPRIARAVAEGTGASRTDVWLRIGDELDARASWPTESKPLASVGVQGDDLPELPGDRAVAVRYQGELLGALTIQTPTEEGLSPEEERLVDDVASQAGLALRNLRLTEELRRLVDELRASRQRLVRAQDEERRKLERNIHDGAQQQLVALAVKVRMADGMMERDLAQAHQVLAAVQADVQSTLGELRDLARGIFPPLLADQGLTAALEAQARKAAVPVEVHADGVERYLQEIETSVYFCCLEALQNVAKYAEASGVRIDLNAHDGELRFQVSDDGRGFDPRVTPRGSGIRNMADRLEAVGGELTIRSSPGHGTTLGGRIPIQPAANDEVASGGDLGSAGRPSSGVLDIGRDPARD